MQLATDSTTRATSQPIGHSSGSKEEITNGQGQGWQDVWAAVLFLLHLVIIICLAILYQDNFHIDSRIHGGKDAQFVITLLYAIIVGIIASLVFGVVWMNVLKKISSSFIKFCLFAFIGAQIVLGLSIFAYVSVLGSLGSFMLAGIGVLYFFFIRRRIAFTSVLIEIASECIKVYSAPIWIALIMQIVSFALLLLWMFTVIAVSKSSNGSNDESGAAPGLVLLVSLLWTMNVAKNVVHVTVAGVVATWFFAVEARNNTSKAMKRALTTSFGSICFGSLVVAIVSALRSLMRSQNNDSNAFMRCILNSCILCIERMAEFITKYAFTYVGIYGHGFIQASKETWQLLTGRGLDVLINDNLTGLVLLFSALIGGVVAAAAGALAGLALYLNKESITATLIASFILGAGIVAVMMSVLDSSVATIMVLWAEEPHALQQNHQRLHAKLADAVRSMYPSISQV